MVLLLIASAVWFMRGTTPLCVVSAVVGAALFLSALLAPPVLVPVQKAWMKAAAVVGWVNTCILLTAVFFLVVTPTSLALRLFRRDPMQRKWWHGDAGSYWKVRPPEPFRPEHMHRQF